MGTVKLAAALPKEPDRNGLMAHSSAMLRRPGDQRVIVLVCDTKTIEDRQWEGIRVPVLGIHSAELLDGEDAEVVKRMMERASDRRMGGIRTPLPLGQDGEQ